MAEGDDNTGGGQASVALESVNDALANLGTSMGGGTAVGSGVANVTSESQEETRPESPSLDSSMTPEGAETVSAVAPSMVDQQPETQLQQAAPLPDELSSPQPSLKDLIEMGDTAAINERVTDLAIVPGALNAELETLDNGQMERLDSLVAGNEMVSNLVAEHSPDEHAFNNALSPDAQITGAAQSATSEMAVADSNDMKADSSYQQLSSLGVETGVQGQDMGQFAVAANLPNQQPAPAMDAPAFS